MLTVEQQKQIADIMIAAGVPIGTGIALIPGGQVLGPIFGAVISAGGRIWELCLDPAQPLIDLSGEKARAHALVTAAKAEADADARAKFGNDGTVPKAPDTIPSGPPSAVRIEPTNDGSDVYDLVDQEPSK